MTKNDETLKKRSVFTAAFLEDTGLYKVNYDLFEAYWNGTNE